MKTPVLFLLGFCLSSAGLLAQQSVRTGSGDEYILYPNGTWGKVAESTHGKKVILLNNGTWKEYDLAINNNQTINNTNTGNTGNTNNANNTNTNTNNTGNATKPDDPNAPATAQVSDGLLQIWRNGRVVENIKFEYESDLKGGYQYALGCAPYRFDKASGEVRFLGVEVIGKANSTQEAQGHIGNHFVQNLYRNTYGRLSSDGLILTLVSDGNELRKVNIQRITDLANDHYIYNLDGFAYRYDRKSGELKLSSGEVLGKVANEKEAKNLLCYHFVYKKV